MSDLVMFSNFVCFLPPACKVMISVCVSSHPVVRGGGLPHLSRLRGYPLVGTGLGYPLDGTGYGGTPLTGLVGGTPPPPSQLDWMGEPPMSGLDGGTPLPSRLDGVTSPPPPPQEIGRLSSYASGGSMPLAFT